MRDHLLLYVNGRRQRVSGCDCFLSLSDYLRLRLGLVGTKIVCSEGDCGSCTVLVGRRGMPSLAPTSSRDAAKPRSERGHEERRESMPPVDGDRITYRPVDSCIQWMFQLDGTHVVSVEGLSTDRCLTPVQDAMVRCHGSQCGFCTPGFVVAMTGLLEGDAPLTEADWRRGLTGNLCRCTGYVPIFEAGLEFSGDAVRQINDLYTPAPIVRDLADVADDTIAVEAASRGRVRRFLAPVSLDDAVCFLRDHPDAKVVAGATDVGVQLNKGVIDPEAFLDLNRVTELEGVAEVVGSNGQGRFLSAGSRATWTDVEEFCRDAVPEFYQIVSVFGAPQIRHVGTIGGNIINASPIADSLPFLMVMQAELDLTSATGTRSVPINKFYRGYKKLDLRPGELLSRVRVPLPGRDDLLRLFRVSRRRDLDIATFTAAIWMRLDGETIDDVRLAFGAVGPTVIRATRTEKFLHGKPFDEETLRAAGDVAVSEITPISDVRGGADFRYQLTRNVLLKFYHEQAATAV